MRRTFFLLCTVIFLFAFTGCNDGKVPVSEKGTGENKSYHLDSTGEDENGTNYAVFEGIRHDFILALPEKSENAPLVVMLHGYGETAESFKTQTGFHIDANAAGYAVIYVTGAVDREDEGSQTGWNSGIGSSSNNDVGFLCALVNNMCDKYSFDSSRVFAVGFSNGAFMAYRLAIQANDIFAAVVSVEGRMPEKIWNMKPEKSEIGLFQISGEKDRVVPKKSDGSAQYTKDPAIEDVISYFSDANDLTQTESESVGKESVLDRYFSENSQTGVWHLMIAKGEHVWPGESTGLDINKLIIDFFNVYFSSYPT